MISIRELLRRLGPQPDVPRWLAVAIGELGVAEVPGRETNARILEYWQAVVTRAPGGVHDETPWCSAFLNWAMVQAGLTGTGSALARSWVKWGRNTQPRLGSVVVLPGKADWQGHVGLYMGRGDSPAAPIMLLGGNQDDSVRVKPYAALPLAWRWPEP